LGRMPEEARRILLAGGRVILTGCPPASSYGPTERIIRKRGRYWVAMVPKGDEKEEGIEESKEELVNSDDHDNSIVERGNDD